jgi:hypothetical protein
VVAGEPVAAVFKPAGRRACEIELVGMTLDEFEALRLADREGLYREQAAARMGVFWPSLFVLVLVEPWFRSLGRSVIFQGATRGVELSFVGLLPSVTIQFARVAPRSGPSAIIAALALTALLLKIDVLWVVRSAMGRLPPFACRPLAAGACRSYSRVQSTSHTSHQRCIPHLEPALIAGAAHDTVSMGHRSINGSIPSALMGPVPSLALRRVFQRRDNRANSQTLSQSKARK